MLQTICSNAARSLSSVIDEVALESEPPTNPPPVVVPVKELHPIFGNVPIGTDGWTLERQSIEMLNHWHKKANKVLEPWNAPGDMSDEDDMKFQALHAISWDIYRAACKVELNSASRVAIFLELTERHHLKNGGDDDNVVISNEWLRKITADLKAATAFPQPTKRIGALSKGKKLTRAGLMLRYHAFLVGELNTLGIAFYGCRDYPEQMVPMDDAVNVRTRAGFKNGKYDGSQNRRKRYPFFDETKLTDRARSVLRSLEIDIETADRR